MSDEAFAGLLARIKELEEKVNLIWTQEWVTVATGIGQVVPDDWWLGLGAGAGRIEWDNQATDEINFLNCVVGIGTPTPASDLHIYHATDDVELRIETDKVDGQAVTRWQNDAQIWNAGVQANDLFRIRNESIGNNVLLLGTLAPALSIYATSTGVNINRGVASRGQLDVDQSDASGAKPVLVLDQADVDQVLMMVVGTAAAASANRTLVDDDDFGTPGALIGWIQIEIEDIGNRIPDGDYYIPFYATPT